MRRDRAARERVRLARAVDVVAVDQRQRLEHVLDRLHARVRATLPLVLAPVVIDVAEATLLLGAEVLAEPEHGQVDQVAPLDRRRRLHHGLPVRERVPVVLGKRRQCHVRDRSALQRQPAAGHPVGRVGIDPHRDDRAAEPVGAAGERDLLGRPPPRGLAELGERLLVEGEDEVRLRLHLAVEVVRQGRLVEGDPGAEQILLEHGLARDVREPRHQPLDETGARLRGGGAHGLNLAGDGAIVRRLVRIP